MRRRVVPEFIGVVLAGGRSRRMGRDKALLDIDGSALVERALAAMAAVCDETVLAVGQGRSYPELPVPQVEDHRLDSGPLAGLESALEWAAPRAALVLACDLPRVESSVLERLLSEVGEPDPALANAWLAFRDGRVQPLCGLYSASCGAVISSRLDRGERSVLKVVAALDAHLVNFDDVRPDPFLNVNTPAEYARAGGRIETH